MNHFSDHEIFTPTLTVTHAMSIKAIFIAQHGALIEGEGQRCLLRCGAGAGLRLLAEHDFRLIVIDDGATGTTGTEQAELATSACAPATGNRAAAWPTASEHAGRDTSTQETHARPGRPADNGRRRRRTDLQQWDDSAGRGEYAGGAEGAEGDGGAEGAEAAGGAADAVAASHAASFNRPRSGTASGTAWLLTPVSTSAHGADIAAETSAAIDRPRNPASPAAHTAGAASAAITASTASTTPSPDRLHDLFFREQLNLYALYHCQHAAGHSARNAGVLLSCGCRAPQPALLLRAAYEHGIDLAHSWMVGACLDDVEAGNRAGCRTVMIDNGTETRWQLGRGRVPSRIAADLYGAALLICEEGQLHRD